MAIVRTKAALFTAALSTLALGATLPSVALPTAASPAADSTPGNYYEIEGPLSPEQIAALFASGVSVDEARTSGAYVTGSPAEIAALRAQGYTATKTTSPADLANARVAKVEAERAARGEARATADDFPAGDEDFHTYDEAKAKFEQIARAYPDIAELVSIGESHEGRDIFGLKISDNASADENNEPESFHTCNIHAREHLTTEMCIYMADMFTKEYNTSDRIKGIVDNRVIWIFPMVNPDGSMYDISGGRYKMWRKTREPVGNGEYGTDPNRNFAYKWNCCDGSSGRPSSDTYRGDSPESTVEVQNIANFVRERNRNGQRITTGVDWHTYSELILYPFGYTYDEIVPGMTRQQFDAFDNFTRQMADTNNYEPQQSSELYVADGTSSDWFWGDQKIWHWTFEMHPTSRVPGFYPDDEVIPRETARNREAVLMMLENTDCIYKATGNEERCDTIVPTVPNPDEPGGPTPTPTPTPTPQPTPTPTPTPQPTQPGDAEFENTDSQAIRDYQSISSRVESTYSGGDSVEIGLNINHTCSEDLDITMTTPDGTRNTLKRAGWSYNCTDWSGETADTYPMRSKTDGTWTLGITDRYRGDTGTLNSWRIAFS